MENKNNFGVYIHIPFCKKKCNYCDFISFCNKDNLIEDYIECLKKEIENFDFLNKNVTTIYLGGGTPSYIKCKYIVDILNLLKEKLKSNKTAFKDLEITIEVNPGTVTKEKLEMYKKVGINRLSIGLQETNNNLLKQIGRIHTFEDFLDTYNLAKEVGFNNVNVDLMIALPNQKISDIKKSLEKIVSLNPNHISVYSLIVEEGTLIEKQIEEGKMLLPSDEEERNMYLYVKNFLELAGYNHYEISNFSKKGQESKHNLNCWNQEEYIGFGLASHSYINKTRFCNISNLEKYIENIKNNDFEKNKIIEEKQTKEDEEKEYMMLGFRKIEGVSISGFKEKFLENPLFLYRKELEKLVNEGLIIVDLDNIKLTNKGLDLANIVFEEFV